MYVVKKDGMWYNNIMSLLMQLNEKKKRTEMPAAKWGASEEQNMGSKNTLHSRRYASEHKCRVRITQCLRSITERFRAVVPPTEWRSIGAIVDEAQIELANIDGKKAEDVFTKSICQICRHIVAHGTRNSSHALIKKALESAGLSRVGGHERCITDLYEREHTGDVGDAYIGALCAADLAAEEIARQFRHVSRPGTREPEVQDMYARYSHHLRTSAEQWLAQGAPDTGRIPLLAQCRESSMRIASVRTFLSILTKDERAGIDMLQLRDVEFHCNVQASELAMDEALMQSMVSLITKKFQSGESGKRFRAEIQEGKILITYCRQQERLISTFALRPMLAGWHNADWMTAESLPVGDAAALTAMEALGGKIRLDGNWFSLPLFIEHARCIGTEIEGAAYEVPYIRASSLTTAGRCKAKDWSQHHVRALGRKGAHCLQVKDLTYFVEPVVYGNAELLEEKKKHGYCGRKLFECFARHANEGRVLLRMVRDLHNEQHMTLVFGADPRSPAERDELETSEKALKQELTNVYSGNSSESH